MRLKHGHEQGRTKARKMHGKGGFSQEFKSLMGGENQPNRFKPSEDVHSMLAQLAQLKKSSDVPMHESVGHFNKLR